ncbi:MAG TPA: hypothetical protein VGU43_04550 [Thermoplasmata archaeon]|nr:hypothetical protein [Thermoplasmata archaeon]
MPWTLRGDIVSQITNLIWGFFSSILTGIESFFGNIFSSISNLFATIFQAPATAISTSWASLTAWVNMWGPLAPIITVGIVVLVVLITVGGAWLVLRESTAEANKEIDEVEEGE